MINLTAGGNVPVPTDVVVVKIKSGQTVDSSAYRLFATGKVQGDLDMIFYGQPKNSDGSMSLVSDSLNACFRVELQRLANDVQKIAFAITCDNGLTVGQLGALSIEVSHQNSVIALGGVELQGRQEAALIMGELYRRNSEWKFRFVAQGFNGGLKPLAEHFGVEVADNPTPVSPPITPPAPAAASQPVNLSKISLTKERSSVSLEKKDNYGKIAINLNWNQQKVAQSGGFSFKKLLGSSGGIDLDLGAFVALQNGEQFVIQALGNGFGSFGSEPFVMLMGDDRTGMSQDGEWMNVNGSEWKRIREVLIYAFIYEGIPSWEKTDGVVSVFVPGQPPIETKMTDGNNSRTLCAIARLVNDNGAIKVERLNRYFKHQGELDNAYGWGFNWSAGRK